MRAPIIIVGAGQAGLQLAESLRAEGYDGDLTLIGEETHLPYQRPPLSKAFLIGEMTEDRLVLRGPEALATKHIALITGTAVASIDRSARTVALADGRRLPYRGLALTTGSRPRTLPIAGADCANVLTLRSIDDSRQVAAGIAQARRVAVVGGGFIGLEIAAAARKAGKAVVLLEALDRLLARTSTPLISEFFFDLHKAHAVDLRLGAQVAGFQVAGDRVRGITTADGATHEADLVVVGIGILPNTELAAACGLACDRGIVVDACARTSDPLIVAAGDCTARRLPDGTLIRLESVQNAIEQAKSAAAALLGKERPFTAAPWFWSDQYDVRLQMAGLAAGHDRTIVRGTVAERKFSVFYFKGETLLAVDSINRAPDHIAARKLLDAGKSPGFDQAADATFNLAALTR